MLTRPDPPKSGKIVTRPDPFRPDPTPPAGPSDPWTTLRSRLGSRILVEGTKKFGNRSAQEIVLVLRRGAVLRFALNELPVNLIHPWDRHSPNVLLNLSRDHRSNHLGWRFQFAFPTEALGTCRRSNVCYGMHPGLLEWGSSQQTGLQDHPTNAEIAEQRNVSRILYFLYIPGISYWETMCSGRTVVTTLVPHLRGPGLKSEWVAEC